MKLLMPVAENLIADPKTTLQPKIDRYAASVRSHGVDVQQVNIPLALPVAQVAKIARGNGTDPVQIFGHVAVPLCMDGLDGHGFRAGSKDLLYAVDQSDVFLVNPDDSYQIIWGVPQKRSVGRADFSGMPHLGDELALMSAWMDLNDAVRSGTFQYDNKSILNCELDYIATGTSDRLIAVMEAVTGQGSVLDTRGRFAFQQFFQTWAGKSFLCGAMYDGGHPVEIGEYNTGFARDFASGLIKMCVILGLCSQFWHPDDWYLQRAALVGGAQAVTCGTWQPPSLATWSDKVPIGQALRDGGLNVYTVCGDVMLLRPPAGTGGEGLSQAQYDEVKGILTGILGRLDAIEGKKTTDPPPPTALAWNLGGPDAGAFKAGVADNGQRYDTKVALVATVGVPNAAPPAVYLTGWIGLGGFTMTRTGITPGDYTLLLHGEESWWGDLGARVQDFSVNGVLLFPSVDWLKVAGAQHKAAVVSAPVTIRADGKLVIRSVSKGASDQYAWLCGVELRAA